MPKIAYLAPEIPGLSATFVYEELHCLERCGVGIVPISVLQPNPPAKDEAKLAARTVTVYDRAKWKIALSGLWRLASLPGISTAMRWLARDMAACGFASRNAWKLGFQFLAAVRVADVLRKQRCRHLHIHFAHVPTQIGMYAAAMAEIPFTIMAHANDIFERGFLLAEKAERAHRFLTISSHNVDHLRSLGLPEDKLAVVRCGVSFQSPAAWPQASAKTHFRIGTLGRLVEKKGVDVLLKAVAGLSSRPYGLEVSIAGDGPLRGELEVLAGELGIAEKVEFIGGLAHRDVAGWMSGLDLFVVACKQDRNGDMDGIPVVLMEAMSQGVPVISSRLSGIPELVIDGETGLLANPSDAVDLAAQIDSFLSSPDLRQRLSLRAAEHVRDEFGQQTNTERLLRHFRLNI